MGRDFKIEKAKTQEDFAKRRAETYHQQKTMNPPSNVLFIGGINYVTDEKKIFNAFEQFGKIKHINVPSDPQNLSKNRGFAHITFETQEAAVDALTNLNGS